MHPDDPSQTYSVRLQTQGEAQLGTYVLIKARSPHAAAELRLAGLAPAQQRNITAALVGGDGGHYWLFSVTPKTEPDLAVVVR